MNEANIKELIDHLKELETTKPENDVGFNMSEWYNSDTHSPTDMSPHHCGTVACLAGHAAIVGKLDINKDPSGKNTNYIILDTQSYNINIFAKEFLGLTKVHSLQLFMPTIEELGMTEIYDITIDQAIRTLEKLLKTGKVDWSHVAMENLA